MTITATIIRTDEVEGGGDNGSSPQMIMVMATPILQFEIKFVLLNDRLGGKSFTKMTIFHL